MCLQLQYNHYYNMIMWMELVVDVNNTVVDLNDYHVGLP